MPQTALRPTPRPGKTPQTRLTPSKTLVWGDTSEGGSPGFPLTEAEVAKETPLRYASLVR